MRTMSPVENFVLALSSTVVYLKIIYKLNEYEYSIICIKERNYSRASS